MSPPRGPRTVVIAATTSWYVLRRVPGVVMRRLGTCFSTNSCCRSCRCRSCQSLRSKGSGRTMLPFFRRRAPSHNPVSKVLGVGGAFLYAGRRIGDNPSGWSSSMNAEDVVADFCCARSIGRGERERSERANQRDVWCGTALISRLAKSSRTRRRLTKEEGVFIQT